MKEKLANLDTIVSLLLALITIIEWSLNFYYKYIVLSFCAIIFIWMIIMYYIWENRPWHKDLRPNILKLKRNKIKQLFSIVFQNPLYESRYICPKFDSQYMNDNIFNEQFTEQITVIIEDDPVGFIGNFGCIYPAITINEDSTHTEIHTIIESIKEEIIEKKILFIATPSRRLSESQSCNLNDKIGQAIKNFFQKDYTHIRIVSKIDSCLRSNYESEYNGLEHGYGKFSLEILIPSYIEQGRITVYGEQYIKIDGKIEPIHKSEFASFKGLEFKSSNLALWAESKCKHIGSRNNIGLIDIDMLRSLDETDIASKIINRAPNVKMIVFDNQDEYDLIKIMKILFLIEASEKHVFYKFGPSMINKMVKIYSSKQFIPRPISISGISINDKGLFIAGSLSTKTKLQIANLRDESQMSIVLISEEEIENQAYIKKVIEKKTNKIIEKNKRGDNVILTTEFWKRDNSEYPTLAKRDIVLTIFAEISKNIKCMKNRWFLFKGSDTALYTLTKGLNIKVFFYCGQVIPGVIHCQCKTENNELKSFFIVGGNVGNDDMLVNFINKIPELVSNTKKC